jgi:regulator of protease activity HflC (stomatin/prohibitin superfamily)
MQERELKLSSGWVWLAMLLVQLAAGIGLIVSSINPSPAKPTWELLVGGIAVLVIWLVMLFGFVINGPNQARVIQLFGKYVGTVKDTGFFYGNPFYAVTKVSLRVRTFETGMKRTEEVKDATGKVLVAGSQSRQPLKVNDKDGTPIEIAAVVVWKVVSPAEAVFQVDDYEDFVHIQSDAALRNLASRYSYDAPEDDRHSLRGHIDEVAKSLQTELQDRMMQAGVEIIEARISTLAYAPEIASAMLQRQQAAALIAARRLIVDAAVSMVEHALDELGKRNVVELDSERRAAMVGNLLVVLCGHSHTQPIVNTGTLYN